VRPFFSLFVAAIVLVFPSRAVANQASFRWASAAEIAKNVAGKTGITFERIDAVVPGASPTSLPSIAELRRLLHDHRALGTIARVSILGPYVRLEATVAGDHLITFIDCSRREVVTVSFNGMAGSFQTDLPTQATSSVISAADRAANARGLDSQSLDVHDHGPTTLDDGQVAERYTLTQTTGNDPQTTAHYDVWYDRHAYPATCSAFAFLDGPADTMMMATGLPRVVRDFRIGEDVGRRSIRSGDRFPQTPAIAVIAPLPLGNDAYEFIRSTKPSTIDARAATLFVLPPNARLKRYKTDAERARDLDVP